MATTGKDQLIAWLNDAYAMEQQLVQTLQAQVQQAADFPQAQAKLQEHLEQTKQHAQTDKQCVERLGGDVSQLKSALSSMMGIFQGISTSPAADTMMKNTLADYGAESFEVACYTSLIAAANELGQAEVAQALQTNLQQDRAMQEWIMSQIQPLTGKVLAKVAGAATG